MITKFGKQLDVHFLGLWDIAPGNFAKWRKSTRKKGQEKPARPFTSSHFYHCRDQFHRAFSKTCRDILFCCGTWQRTGQSKGPAVAYFIRKIETRLQIKIPTTFGGTQRADVMWLRVSPFWMEEPMRRSLFTALLRAGRRYDRRRNNFEEALYSERYLETTRAAVERFLQGYTHCTTNRYGWVNVFGGAGYRYVGYEWVPNGKPTQAEIEKLLVQPKESRRTTCPKKTPKLKS